MVVEFIKRSEWAPRLELVHEERLLGTGGTILKNRTFFKNEPFLVAHADNLTIFDIPTFLNHHTNRPSYTELTMMIFESPEPQSCGIVELDEQGVVVKFHEKVPSPPSNLANAAVYLIEPSVVDMMANLGNEDIDLSTEVIPHLLGKILTYRNNCYHRDIGTHSSWVMANIDFPIMPATRQNAKAWEGVISMGDRYLERNIEKLLASAKI